MLLQWGCTTSSAGHISSLASHPWQLRLPRGCCNIVHVDCMHVYRLGFRSSCAVAMFLLYLLAAKQISRVTGLISVLGLCWRCSRSTGRNMFAGQSTGCDAGCKRAQELQSS